jgi:hypothetical protein
MDILTFSQQLEVNMKEQLDAARASHPDFPAHIGITINVIREAVYELEQFACNYKFTDQQEEIKFFKETKPVFVSQLLYNSKLFTIRLFDAYQDPESRKQYYYKQLKELADFTHANMEFYQYVMSNATYFDDVYFTRKGRKFTLPNVNPFSTSFDDKLARILANEMLKDHLINVLQHLGDNRQASALAWTASKAAMIELIYALHSAGAFNQSHADIKLIVTTFEQLFNVDLSGHYKIYGQLRERKKGKTSFLDQLKERLTQRFEESGQS